MVSYKQLILKNIKIDITCNYKEHSIIFFRYTTNYSLLGVDWEYVLQ